jgi:acyl phosphate:glycerol-3-phosphate acyltransferase
VDGVLTALLVLVGYLAGSLPMGVIVARLTGGTDPRAVGSGRTGGTNVLRAMGPGRAVLVATLDVAKGALPILLARWAGATELTQALAGLAAVLGAWRSVFLGFQGGRGVATGVGGMLAVSPPVVAVAAPVFVFVIALTRYVSLGSLLSVGAGGLATIVFVVLGWLPGEWLVYALPGTAVVWVAHRDNIERLVAGTERRFDARRAADPGAGGEQASR